MSDDRIFHTVAKCRWCGGRFYAIHDETQWLCETESCAARQIDNAIQGPRAVDGTARYLYLPTPAQVELRECRTKRLLWGGAAAGAKSHGLRWDAYRWCMEIPNYEVLLMRRTFPELESTHLLRMGREAESVGAKYRSQFRMMEWPNGSFIRAGHCESKADLTKLLSTEYDDARIDEASTFDGRLVREIVSRARSSKPLVKARGGAFGRLTSNPGGPGAVYLRDAYITHDMDRDEFPDYRPTEYTFIPARVSDNPYCSADYTGDLMELDRDRRAQLLDGNWDVHVGQFFENFNPDQHVVNMEAK
jgi:hypothetical protein